MPSTDPVLVHAEEAIRLASAHAQKWGTAGERAKLLKKLLDDLRQLERYADLLTRDVDELSRLRLAAVSLDGCLNTRYVVKNDDARRGLHLTAAAFSDPRSPQQILWQRAMRRAASQGGPPVVAAYALPKLVGKPARVARRPLQPVSGSAPIHFP